MDALPIPPRTLARLRELQQAHQQAMLNDLNRETDACAAALDIPTDARPHFDLQTGMITFPGELVE